MTQRRLRVLFWSEPPPSTWRTGTRTRLPRHLRSPPRGPSSLCLLCKQAGGLRDSPKTFSRYPTGAGSRPLQARDLAVTASAGQKDGRSSSSSRPSKLLPQPPFPRRRAGPSGDAADKSSTAHILVDHVYPWSPDAKDILQLGFSHRGAGPGEGWKPRPKAVRRPGLKGPLLGLALLHHRPLCACRTLRLPSSAPPRGSCTLVLPWPSEASRTPGLLTLRV